MKLIAKYCYVLAAAALLLVPATLTAQTPTQTLVGVDSKSGTMPTQADIAIKVGGKATPLTGWAPLLNDQGDGVQIAILIDDSLRISMGQQAADIQNFITHLPPNVLVFVGYIQSTHVTTVHDFSNNHAEVAAAVKPPAGSKGGIANNPYSAIADMSKRWPITPAARILLAFTNGVDPANNGGGGAPDSAAGEGNGQDTTNIHPAQDATWKAGIAVYSIFYNESNTATQDALATGENGLASLGETTGGVSYASGYRSPVLLAPVMDNFRKALTSTYVATFAAPAGKKTAGLKVSTTVKDVKLHIAENVLPGNQEAPAAK